MGMKHHLVLDLDGFPLGWIAINYNDECKRGPLVCYRVPVPISDREMLSLYRAEVEDALHACKFDVVELTEYWTPSDANQVFVVCNQSSKMALSRLPRDRFTWVEDKRFEISDHVACTMERYLLYGIIKGEE